MVEGRVGMAREGEKSPTIFFEDFFCFLEGGKLSAERGEKCESHCMKQHLPFTSRVGSPGDVS